MKRVALIVAAAGTAVLMCVGTGVALISGVLSEAAAPLTFSGICDSKRLDPDAKLPRVRNLGDVQLRNAAIIIKVGCRMQVPPRGWVIALAVAYRESSLRNLANEAVPASLDKPHDGLGADHDSLGLFQQRPSQGWGTPEQLMDPYYAAKKFYRKLLRTKGWQTMSWPKLIDAVQNPANAYLGKYEQYEAVAAELVTAMTGCPGGVARNAGQSTQGCVTGGRVGFVSPAGWTKPAKGSIVSGFRSPGRPGHDGVDFASPRGSPVRAASSGIVTTAMCNASSGNCDVDGSPSVQGCGWYVDILHAGDVITRYCHMGSRPLVSSGDRVKVGQVIGRIGSSGNSSGPHLHFEVHLNRNAGPAGAVDPVPFMAGKGVSLKG